MAVSAEYEMKDDEAMALIDAQLDTVDFQRRQISRAFEDEISQRWFWALASSVLASATVIVTVAIYPGLFGLTAPLRADTLFYQMLPAVLVFIAFLAFQALSEWLGTDVRKQEYRLALDNIDHLEKVARRLVEKAGYRG